ncbi:MAG: tannase/feruloyl esterase family alpha/beta hydrolase [Terracidiphilus sp.]
MKKTCAIACLCIFSFAAAWGQPPASATQKCRDLASLKLPHTDVIEADVTEAGQMAAPQGDEKDLLFGKLPAFCHVQAESHPSADSKIKIDVRLPVDGWNGKFLGVGNGGFAGQIDYRRMARDLLSGYATAGTDTGHTGSGIDATWALGHPEKIADFGYRAVHEMTLTGEAIAQAYYGRAASHRYFASCSDGGREALMEAQRFPTDYDGILAGAPAYNWTDLLTDFLYTVQVLQKDPASYIPAAKLPVIGKAVLAQCSPGSTTGFLDDPRQCHFDPSTLQCAAAENDKCLTAPQVTALKALYAGPPIKDGKTVNHGWLPGAELGQNGWAGWITGPAPSHSAIWAFATGYLANMVYGKTDLDVETLNLEDALKAAESTTGSVLDAVNPDLSAFRAHGGKLILFHGWNDPAIPAPDTVDYFDRVVAAAGKRKADGFVRLFMVPGMQHCAGGPGPDNFGQGGPVEDPAFNDPAHSIYSALESWVETGSAPAKVVARKVEDENGKPAELFSRPLCPYPQAATYSGSGDRNSAASYICAAPK